MQTRFTSNLYSLGCLFVALVSITLFGSASHCKAQTTINFYSTYGKTGVLPPECSAVAKIIGPIIAAQPHPGKWLWLVACDEPAWQRVERHMGQSAEYMQSHILAATDPETHMTYVRGFTILHPVSRALQPEFVISHELGHIMLGTTDEHAADVYAAAQVREMETTHQAIVGEVKPTGSPR
jgi:hypothetical protein